MTSTTSNPREGQNETNKLPTALRQGQRNNKCECDLMPQQKGLTDPNLYTARVKATTESYNSNVEIKRVGARSVHGEGERLLVEQRETMLLPSSATLQQPENIGSGEGKNTIPPAHRCARDTPATTSV